MSKSKVTKKTRAQGVGAPHAKAATPKKPGGGTAAGGGINYQAAVTAIAGVHLLRGASLEWHLLPDIPKAVWAESEGPGDDVRLDFESNVYSEIQIKKGLRRGENLWDALDALVKAVIAQNLEYGVLVVAPDSSRTIREDLAKDLERIAQGRHDNLTRIGAELHRRLKDIRGNWQQACERISIRVVHALKVDDADIRSAKELLRWVCADEMQANAAWNALYRDAVTLIEHRGRWTMTHLVGLFQREGILVRDDNFPAAVATKISKWVRSTNKGFTLSGARKRLPLSAMLEMRAVGTAIEQPEAEDAAAALARYHGAAAAFDREGPVYDAEWIGQFMKHAVVVAGPGLGKSTLMTLLANRYATDGFPVLSVKLKPIAAAMERGVNFVYALLSQGLDGSGITPERFDSANLNDLVVLADGLDDCGGSHDTVARALYAFATGHPSARVIVTTRPIGYSTAALVDWKHYRLLAPNKENGAENLAKLLSALKTSEDSSEDMLPVAERELAASRTAGAISSSPHFLGMAAALISSKGNLPNTRPQLYTDLISLFETAGQSVTVCPIAPAIARHVLNGLGWLLMHDSLATAETLSQRCAELLAEPMGRTPLATIELVDPALRYWEQLGIIEQIYHDGIAFWSFVHKTFAEFSAACHLNALPGEQRVVNLDNFVDQPDWHEVIAFAGGLGSGDEIARLLIERRASGHAGQMERALALASDRDAEVSDGLVQQLAGLALEAVGAEGKDQFSVGLALSELAEVHPAIVGEIAAKFLQDERSGVQLVAWACAVAAEPNRYDADELAQIMISLLPTVSKSITANLLGGISIGGGKDRDLIEQIALAALASQPNSGLKAFAEAHFCHEPLSSQPFQLKVYELLCARGVGEEIELPWIHSSAASIFALLNPPEDQRIASEAAERALLDAVDVKDLEISGSSSESSKFPQFAALVDLTGFSEVPAYDVYQWSKPYDRSVVRQVLQALVHASAIDSQALNTEVSAVLRLANAADEFWRFYAALPQVDVPEPDWRKAAAFITDRSKLVAALNHGSVWLAYVAGSILAAMGATREQSRSLLEGVRGSSLWAATQVVREQQPPDIANALILDRLEGPFSEGAEHLFSALEEGKVEYSGALCEAIRRGLSSTSPTIADAAANLAKFLVECEQPLETDLIVDAYDDWLIREPDQKGSEIPQSPRETLLKVLISQNALDDDRLLAALSDARSDVRRICKERILELIDFSNTLRNSVIQRIVSRSLPPAVSARVLQCEPHLSGEQIRTLEPLLREKDPKWRRVGVELLRRCYLSADEIRKHCENLSGDDQPEIRRVVKARLAAAKIQKG